MKLRDISINCVITSKPTILESSSVSRGSSLKVLWIRNHVIYRDVEGSTSEEPENMR